MHPTPLKKQGAGCLSFEKGTIFKNLLRNVFILKNVLTYVVKRLIENTLKFFKFSPPCGFLKEF